jgi:hypothetical protein
MSVVNADPRPTSPPEGSITIVTSDSTVIAPALCAIYIGGTGDVKVRMLDGSTPTFKAVPVGTTLQGQFDKVFATGTSATLLVGLYRLP